MGFKYKGVEFSKGLNCSFEDFKKKFANNRYISDLDSKKKLAIYKEVMKANGNVQRVKRKSRETKTTSGKE